jgi:hypothetical protein
MLKNLKNKIKIRRREDMKRSKRPHRLEADTPHPSSDA